MITRLGVFACAVSFLIPIPVLADVVYDNGGPDATLFGSNSTVFQTLNPDFASFDDFVLDEGSNTISDLHWWGNYGFQFTETVVDGFIIYIFDDDAGHPDLSNGPLHVIDGDSATRTYTGSDAGGNEDVPIFEYDLFFDPITLDPDVVYWLAITNDFHWFWQSSDVPGGAYIVDGLDLEDSFTASEGDLDPVNTNLAFNLTNTVIPEPSTVMLLGAGIAVLAARRRFMAKGQ